MSDLFKELDEHTVKYTESTVGTFGTWVSWQKAHDRLLLAKSVEASLKAWEEKYPQIMLLHDWKTVSPLKTKQPEPETEKSVMYICDKAGECRGRKELGCEHGGEHKEISSCTIHCCASFGVPGAQCRPVKPELKPEPEPPKADINPGDWVMWKEKAYKVLPSGSDTFIRLTDGTKITVDVDACRPLPDDDPYWASQMFKFPDAVEYEEERWIVQRITKDKNAYWCFSCDQTNCIPVEWLRPWVPE